MSDIDGMNVGLRWYIAHTYAGYENKVKASLEKIVENRGLGNLIYDIKVPAETVIEKNGDKEKVVEIKTFPSYVFVKMIMTDESWHAVRNITGVTGFVGPGSRPEPLPDSEVAKLSIEAKPAEIGFGVGDVIEIIDGLFAGHEADVQEISDDGKTLKVLVHRGRRGITSDIKVSEARHKA